MPASAALPDGTYAAQASQVGSAGNTGTGSANTFTINGPPVVTLSAPADNAIVGTHTPAINGGRVQAAGDLPTVTVKRLRRHDGERHAAADADRRVTTPDLPHPDSA